jgi:hypothetical protein
VGTKKFENFEKLIILNSNKIAKKKKKHFPNFQNKKFEKKKALISMCMFPVSIIYIFLCHN